MGICPGNLLKQKLCCPCLESCDPSEMLELPSAFSKEKMSTNLQPHIIIFYDNLMLM